MLDLQFFVDAATRPDSSEAMKKCAADFKTLTFVHPPLAAPGALPSDPQPVFTVVRKAVVAGSSANAVATNATNEAWFKDKRDKYKKKKTEWMLRQAVRVALTGVTAAPQNNLQTVTRDPVFTTWVASCYAVAMEDAQGLKPWVNKLWLKAKRSLSDPIRTQVDSVRAGDLIKLMECLRLAVHQVEDIKPHLVKMELMKSTMKDHADDDVLTYISYVTTQARRLKTALKPVDDEELQSIFVSGLDEQEFAEIIKDHERAPCASFEELCSHVRLYITRPGVNARLKAKKRNPIVPLMAAATSKSSKSEIKTILLAAITDIMAKKTQKSSASSAGAGAADAKDAKSKPCWKFKAGKCKFGADCRFGHFVPEGKPREAGSSTGPCRIHGEGHSDAQCRTQNKGRQPGGSGDPMKDLMAILEMRGGEEEEEIMLMLHVETQSQTLPTVPMAQQKQSDFIMMDNCAGANCGNGSWAVPGTMVSINKRIKVTGLGEAFIKYKYTARVLGLIDPDHPEATPKPANVQDVYLVEHSDFKYPLVISRGKTLNTGAKWLTKYIREADPDNDITAIVQEKFWTRSGQHIFTARTDEDTGVNRVMVSLPASHSEVKVIERVVLPAIATFDESMLMKPQLDVQLFQQEGASPEVHLPKSSAQAREKNTEVLATLHGKYNHAMGMRTLSRQWGIPVAPEFKCLPCNLGAPKKSSLDDALEVFKASKRSARFSVDWVPMPVVSYEGFTGFFMISEEVSGYYWLIPCVGQADWCEVFQRFVFMVEAHEGSTRAIQIFTSDQAMCFENCRKCAVFAAERGIQLHFSARQNQAGNPIEGQGRFPKQVGNVIMIESGAAESLPRIWPKAMKAAAISCNFVPRLKATVAQVQGPTKFEIWHGVTVPRAYILKRIFPFLCLALAKKGIRAETGFGLKVDICAFVSHCFEKKSHELYNLETKQFQHNAPTEVKIFPQVRPLQNNSIIAELLGLTLPRASIRSLAIPTAATPASHQVTGLDVTAAQRRLQQIEARLPKNVWSAITGEDKNLWLPSIVKHFKVLKQNNCFGKPTTTRPSGKVFVMPLLFKHKIPLVEVFASNIPAAICKTRSIVLGNQFVAGLHYSEEEVAAQQVRPESLKCSFVYAIYKGKIPFQLDVVQAYYRVKMDPLGIWVQLPDGFDPFSDSILPKDHPRYYAEMLRLIPGSPQGSLLFQKEVHKALKRAGWETDASDANLFQKCYAWQKDPDVISIHADDFALISDPDLKGVRALIAKGPDGIGDTFPEVTCEYMTQILGNQVVVEYTEYNRRIFLTNTKILRAALEHANPDMKTAKTPIVPGLYVSKHDCPTSPEEVKLLEAQGLHAHVFRQALGSTAYAAVWTRTGAKFAHRALSTVMTNPGKKHFAMLQHFLGWIKGTINHGLEFVHTPRSPKIPFVDAHTDSSHKDCPDTQRSTQAYVARINHTPISSKVSVSKSACSTINVSEFGAYEAATVSAANKDRSVEVSDLMAVENGGRTVVWVQECVRWLFGLPKDLDMGSETSTDSTGVRAILKGGQLPWDANKHILHRAQCVIDLSAEHKIKNKKVDTADNVANGIALTKQIASVELSASELSRLEAPYGRNPVLDYGDFTIKYPAEVPGRPWLTRDTIESGLVGLDHPVGPGAGGGVATECGTSLIWGRSV
jgi:hypothetical protein